MTSAAQAAANSRLTRYKANMKFWMSVDPTVQGMLQGYGHLSAADAKASVDLLASIISGPKALTKPTRALDCGAGIGRVSKEVLLPLFDGVDLVEQNDRFMASAPNFIGYPLNEKVGQYFCSGLQDFNPANFGPYNVIWIQWVIGYLTDADLTEFFVRCKKSLADDGVLVIKDNMKRGNTPQCDFDEEDGSVCRPEPLVLALLKRAGFVIHSTATQPHFPADLYPVRMICAVKSERKLPLENSNNHSSK